MKAVRVGVVRHVCSFTFSSPSTDTEKSLTLSTDTTYSPLSEGVNSVSYKAENSSRRTPGAKLCMPAVVTATGVV